MIMFMMADSSEERTEKATPKKRKDTREKGQVLKSTEVNTAAELLIMVTVIKMFGSGIVGKLFSVFNRIISAEYMYPVNFDFKYASRVIIRSLFDILYIIFPFLTAAVIASIASNYLQIGFLYTTKPLKPDLTRLNPVEGFKRIFSMRALAELLKSVLKIALIGSVIYSEYNKKFGQIPQTMEMDVIYSASYIFDSLIDIAYKAVFMLAVIAAADYFYQKYDYEKKLMMSKKEVLEEYKQTEGDPKIKGQIKKRQREISSRRMIRKVPTADFVVTNPTHFAVAVRYDEKRDKAPVVVAKGQDLLAQKIKKIAAENNIDMVENKALARALYATCEVDQQIPPEFFKVVAEILAFVYKNRRK